MLSYIPYSEDLFLMLFPNSNECLKLMKFVKPQKMVDILEINETELSSWLREDSTIFKEFRNVKNKLGEPEFQKKVSEAYLCMIKGISWSILDEPQENACNKNREISNDLEVIDIKEAIHENMISKIDEDTTNTCEEIEDNDAVERNILRNIPFDVDVLISLYPKYKKLFNFLRDTNIKTISEFLNLSDESLFSSRGTDRRLYEYEEIKKILSVNENQQTLLIAFNERGIENIENGEELQQNDVVEENNILSRIPFDAELLEILMSREYLSSINILKTKNIANMASFVKIRSEQISRWNAVGSVVLRKIQEMQNYCIENQSQIEEVYNLCKVEHTFPKKLSLEQEEFSLEGKIHIAIEQYIEFLSKKSQYLGSLVNDLERIKLLYIDRKSIIDIAGELNLTYERVRQLKSKYLNAMFEGTLKGAENFKFSDSLKNEIEYFKGRLPLICSNITLCEMLQCDNYDDSYSSLILHMEEITPVNNENFYDQKYFISNETNKKWAKDYIKLICGVLGWSNKNCDIRPMSLDNIMDMLEIAKPNDFEFDRETVLDLLEQHTWIEKLNINDIEKFQLRYENLNTDYKKLGRLVYEFKEVTVDNIDNLHKEKMNDSNARSIINAKENLKKHITWVVNGGQNGILKYSETGKEIQSLRAVVREWIRNKELFTFEEAINAFTELGYTNLNHPTIRTYLLEGCCVENTNQDLFCNMDYIEKYSDYSWRNKSQHGIVNWLMFSIYTYLIENENHKLSLKEIKDKLNDDSNKTEENYAIRTDVLTLLMRYIKCENPLFSYENKELSLTKLGLEKPSEEWKLIGLRNKKPDYYGVIVSNIVSILRDSNTGEMLMSDVRKICLEDIESPAKNSFYKIVDNFLPKQISKLYKDGKAYLKLEQNKVEYVDSMVVQTVEKDNETVEEVVVSEKERPIYKVGTYFEIDWPTLRDDFIRECKLYSRDWLSEISYEDSIDKFIRFIRSFDPNTSRRLSVNLPRHLFQFWNYQNDDYAYEAYLNDILFCYERLLREIYRKNTGKSLDSTKGLVDTVMSYEEVRNWIDTEISQYTKFYFNLKNDRNKLSHGEEHNKNLIGIVLSITQYIALYIYTVAKFWNEE